MTAANRTRTAAAAALWLVWSGPAAAGRIVECVLARVNDEVITLTDFEQQKKSVLEDLYRQQLAEEEVQKQIEEARDRLLPSLIEERLLLQKAHDLGYSVAKEEVDRIVKSIMEQNKIADEADLANRLSAEGLTLATLRRTIEKRSLLEKLRQFEIASKVVVTDEAARRFHEEHKEEFREPERVRLREIVLLIEKRPEDQVRKEIEEIAALIRNGADFAELATLFSQAPTAEHGGDLGLVRTSDLSPEIAEASAKLEPGAVSEPVRTRFGFHILKLVERKPVVYRTFEEARDAIVRRIQEERVNDRTQDYVARLKETAFVRIDDACRALAP